MAAITVELLAAAYREIVKQISGPITVIREQMFDIGYDDLFGLARIRVD